MKKAIKYSVILLALTVCLPLTAQNSKNEILSDSAKFAEYIYTNMRYPLVDYINNVEGMATYKYELVDSVLNICQLKTVRSSGSDFLDREGRRLILSIPMQKNHCVEHEIAINFRLADNKIYNFVEEMPEFPGGMEEMMKFTAKNLHFPPECAESAISGTIICGFIIEKDGSIGAIEVTRSLERYLDAEAVRVIKRMPNWKPGKKDGKPVRVYYTLPIKIKLLPSE